MNRFYRAVRQALGKIYVPHEVISHPGRPRILHLSDTPALIFPELRNLIHKTKPDYIIHTGDLVDNLKLGLYPNLIEEYKRQLYKLAKHLSQFPNIELHIVTGNHDHPYLVRSIFKTAHVYDRPTTLEINSRHFHLSHYKPADTEVDCTYFLYGHDYAMPSVEMGEKVFLNGIEHIHVIDLKENTIYRLLYPVGTDSSRQNKYKIGL